MATNPRYVRPVKISFVKPAGGVSASNLVEYDVIVEDTWLLGRVTGRRKPTYSSRAVRRSGQKAGVQTDWTISPVFDTDTDFSAAVFFTRKAAAERLVDEAIERGELDESRR